MDVQRDKDQSCCLHIGVGHILFFAHSSGGLLGGRPAPGIDFAYFFFFFQSDGNFSCVKWGFFGEKLEDICAY